MENKHFYLRLIVLVFIFISCRVHKNKLIVKSITVNFLNGNNYSEFSNVGNFNIVIKDSDTLKNTTVSKNEFDAYSPLKRPIQIILSKNKSSVLLKACNKTFLLGELNSKDSICNFNCNLVTSPSDKISFKSYVNFLPYWHGLSPLGGLPLFMHYHTYKLQIKKPGHQNLLIKWKYSVYKYKRFDEKSRGWSGDYCEDNGGGLIKVKIK